MDVVQGGKFLCNHGSPFTIDSGEPALRDSGGPVPEYNPVHSIPSITQYDRPYTNHRIGMEVWSIAKQIEERLADRIWRAGMLLALR